MCRRERRVRLRGLNLRLVQDFLLLSGGEFFSKMIGFLAFGYLARLLEPGAYGAVELAVSLSLFFFLVVDFGLSPVGAREVARDPHRVQDLAGEIPVARGLVALVAIPVMCGLAALLGQPTPVVRLVWVFSLGLLGVAFHQLWLFQGLELMRWVSLAHILRTSAFAIGVGLVVRSPADLLLVGVVEVGAAAVLAGYCVVVQGRHVAPFRLSMNPAGVTRLFREGLSVGLSQTVWALNQYLPTLLIAGLVTSVEVAFFGSAHRIVTSLATFGFVYHFNFFPAVSRSLADSDEAYRDLVTPSFKATAWGGIGLALVVTLLADTLCRLAYGDGFAVAGPTLAVLVWTIPLTLFSGHARWALIARGEQRFVLVAQLAGAVTTLVAGGWAITRWGARGGAIGMVASSLVVWVVAHACARRKVTRIPFLGAAARPAFAALAVGLVATRFDGSAWVSASGAALLFALLGPALDWRLVADLRRLARAKEGIGPARESQGTVGGVG